MAFYSPTRRGDVLKPAEIEVAANLSPLEKSARH